MKLPEWGDGLSRSEGHRSRGQALNTMYDNKTSIEYIESRFPELGEALHDEIIDGLLHPQLGEFSRLAQSVIDESSKAGWSKVTTVFMQLWSDCTPEVKNALNVSFLEHLNFTDGKRARSWAYREMPKPMRKAWEEMNEYNRSIHGG